MCKNGKSVSKKKKIRSKNKNATRVAVDKSKWGATCNTYDTPPDYYYDEEFTCRDCGTKETWFAERQKVWFEELQKDINTRAVYCSKCRAHMNAIKEEQKRHTAEKAKEQQHPHEEFFKKKYT